MGAIALGTLVGGIVLAVQVPTTTTVRRHMECFGRLGPCTEVVGPVRDEHRGIRLAIGIAAVLPLAAGLAVALVSYLLGAFSESRVREGRIRPGRPVSRST